MNNAKTALDDLRKALDSRFEAARTRKSALVTAVSRDGNNNATGVTATIDNQPGISVAIPYGHPVHEGAEIEVEMSRTQVVGPQYTLTRVLSSSLVTQQDVAFGDIPTPVFGTLDTAVPDASSGGPASGIHAYINVRFTALDYAKYKIQFYMLQVKKSTDADWSASGINIIASEYAVGTTIAYQFTDLEIETYYNFRAAAFTAAGVQSAWAVTTLQAAGDHLAPAAPTGLTGSAAPGAVLLDWDDNAERDLRLYKVYFSVSSSGPWTLYQTTRTSTALFGTTATSPWYFYVTAVDTSGNESSASAVAGPYTAGAASTVGDPPTVPSGVTATWTAYVANGTQFGRVSTQWTKSTFSDASDAYMLRWRDSADGVSWKEYKQAVVTSPTQISSTVREWVVIGLRPATYYEFQVAAYDASGRASAWSTAATLNPSQTTVDLTPPSDVTGLASADGGTTFYTSDLHLVWNPNTDEDLAGYRIEFHSSAAFNSGSRLRTEFLASPPTSSSGKVVYQYGFAKNVADRPAVSGDLQANATVYAAVWAMDTAGNLSTNAATATFVNPVPPAVTPGTPSNLFRFVFFNWSTIPDPDNRDLDHYQVVIEESDDGTFGVGHLTTVLTTKSSDATIVYSGQGGYSYRAKITGYDVFTQPATTATSATVLCDYTPIITPEDLAGRAYQITPSAQSGIVNSANSASLSASDLAKLFDYDKANTALKNPDTTWRYIQFEYPVQFTFNMSEVYTVSTDTAKCFVAYYNGPSPANASQLADTTNWEYLSGNASSLLDTTDASHPKWVDTGAVIATAQAQAPTLPAGTNVVQWPTMRQARYVRLYLGSNTRIAEWKNDVYLIADNIDAGTLNLARGINIFNDATSQGVKITSSGINVVNGLLNFNTASSGATTSCISIDAMAIRAYNASAAKTFEVKTDGTWYAGNYPSGNYVRWDGSVLTVDGSINVQGGNAAMRNLLDGGTAPVTAIAGLYLGSDKLGYYNGAAWTSYIDSNGHFYFGDAGATKYVQWNGTAFTVKGTINADAGYLGALDVTGALSVSTGGNIHSGQTAYNTGTGFWLEYNAGTPRFSLGSSSNAVTWDGSTLQVSGTVSAVNGSSFVANDVGLDNTGIKWYDSSAHTTAYGSIASYALDFNAGIVLAGGATGHPQGKIQLSDSGMGRGGFHSSALIDAEYLDVWNGSGAGTVEVKLWGNLAVTGTLNISGNVTSALTFSGSGGVLVLSGGTNWISGQSHVLVPNAADGNSIFYKYDAAGKFLFRKTATVNSVASPTDLFYIDNSGNIWYSGSNLSSDERLKTNIVSLRRPFLSAIEALRPVQFEWAAKSPGYGTGIRTGLIAQEVQRTIPEAVREAGPETGEGDEYLGIDYNVIVVHLIGAVNELRDDIERLKARH